MIGAAAPRRIGITLSACLSGAAGMGSQVQLLSCAGLALGYGGSTALGLAAYLAGWAAGAFCAGRGARRPARALLAIGVASALLPLPVQAYLLAAGSTLAGAAWIGGPALAAIACAAAAQGAFLPLLAAGDSADVERPIAHLWAASLAGALCGAGLIADRATGAYGRYGAAAIAGGVALLATAIGVLSARHPRSRPAPEHEPATIDGGYSPIECALIVGLGTAWMSAQEWIGLRLGCLWLGGMQPALTSILCASLLALALGAAVLPLLVPRGRAGVLAILALAALASAWPFAAAWGQDGLAAWAGDGALERVPLLLRALVLVGPALLPFGALVPCLHRVQRGAGGSGARLAGLLAHEAWGALIGIPLVHLWIVPVFGLSGAIAFALVLAVLALGAARRASPRTAASVALLALAGAVLAGRARSPSEASAPLSNPALVLRAFRDDRDFAVAVVDDGIVGERTLLTDGFRAAGTGRDYPYMQALGHLPLLLHPSPRRVAVLALGTGTTVGAVSLHAEVESIDVLEISRAVVAAAPYFSEKNHGALAEATSATDAAAEPRARIVVRLGDGRRTLASLRGAYDVITMEPLLPDSPFAVYLYTREFYALARRALDAGGLVCQWVPPHALEPETFAAVLDAFAGAFPWSGVWLYGTQVILLGAEAEPAIVAGRFPERTSALGRDLDALGLGSAADVLARWCGSARAWVGTTRALRDADPWIVHRPRRSGSALLFDLPLNLGSLRRLRAEPPTRWLESAGPAALVRSEGLHALRDAREASAFAEAALRSAVHPSDADVPGLEASVARARGLVPGDRELVTFESDLAFLGQLRRGVGLLGTDPSRSGAESALEPLVAAAELRPERGDVHLYLALVLERLGSAAAENAFQRALEACPRIAETHEGRRARTLGLSDERWSRAQASANAARVAPERL